MLCRHAGRARVRDRPLLHADREAARRQQAARDARARRGQFRRLPDVERALAAREPLPGRPRRSRQGEGRDRQAPGGRGGRGPGPRHLRARRHRLGGRDPRVPGGARELLARRSHRARGQSALRRARDHGIRKSSPASPPGRTGFSSAPTRSARRARSSVTAPARSRHSIRGGCDANNLVVGCRPRASGTHRAPRRGRWNMGPRLRGDDMAENKRS